MDDIKRIKKQVKPKRPTDLGDLAFLKQSDKSSVQEIKRPNRVIDLLSAKFSHVFALNNRGKLAKYLGLTIVLILILLTGIYLGTKINSNPAALSTDIPIRVTEEILPASTSVSLGGPVASFVKGAYYKVELVDERIYYGNLSKVEKDHYELTSVFYNIADAGLAGENKITLTKLTNDQDQPQDKLLIPRARVNTISQLTEDSPIVEAIQKYLTDN